MTEDAAITACRAWVYTPGIDMKLQAFAWAIALVASFLGAAHAAEPSRVEVPSLDRAGDSVVQMPAFWYRAEVAAPAPAMLLLHGCGGPYADAPPQRLSARMREYAAILNSEGFHVLITDSLSPRGERELCTQRVGARKVTQTQRRRDALGALQWLSNQPEVDARRLGLLGWSNGGSNVLSATNGRHPEVAAAPVKAHFAAAFYPGCEDDLKRGYQVTVPLLMLVGELGTTILAPCWNAPISDVTLLRTPPIPSARGNW